ncbi:MAG: Flp pilus assembly protein CpaB [Actinomycetota bacterium]
MNPRQRRGVILLGLAVLGGVAVFVLVAGYVADVRSQVGHMMTVQRLTEDVPAFTAVSADMVEEVRIPERWAPEHAITEPVDLAGRIASTDLPSGSLLQEGMLIPQPAIEPGEREVAILVDAETGVAGKISPGSVVDIFATFEVDTANRCAVVLVPGASVVDVGRPAPREVVTEQGGLGQQAVVPVTFTLTPTDSLRLVHAESYATEVRLGLVRPGDAIVEPPAPFCGPKAARVRGAE